MSAPNVYVAVPISSIVKHLESLPGPRHQRNRRHLLVDVMTLAVCGVIVGCSGPSAIERWAKAKKDWLKELLALPNGIPSRDCIRRVLCALKPEAFQPCFQSWMASLMSEGDDKVVAIDGKANTAPVSPRWPGSSCYGWLCTGRPAPATPAPIVVLGQAVRDRPASTRNRRG